MLEVCFLMVEVQLQNLRMTLLADKVVVAVDLWVAAEPAVDQQVAIDL